MHYFFFQSDMTRETKREREGERERVRWGKREKGGREKEEGRKESSRQDPPVGLEERKS